LVRVSANLLTLAKAKRNMLHKLKHRRSIFPKEYTGNNIPRKDLEQILETARFAPSHKKTQPWRFKVLMDQAKGDFAALMAKEYAASKGKDETFQGKKMIEKFDQSAAVLLLFMHRQEKESLPEWEEIAAFSMAVQNIWLACGELGYGGYWSSPKAFLDVRKFGALQIHERERFYGFFFMGEHGQSTDSELPNRKPLDEVVQWV